MNRGQADLPFPTPTPAPAIPDHPPPLAPPSPQDRPGPPPTTPFLPPPKSHPHSLHFLPSVCSPFPEAPQSASGSLHLGPSSPALLAPVHVAPTRHYASCFHPALILFPDLPHCHTRGPSPTWRAGAAAEGLRDGAGVGESVQDARWWTGGQARLQSHLSQWPPEPALAITHPSLGNILPSSCLHTPLFSLRGGFCGQRIPF